jgi:hypothetical protein
LVAPEFPGDSMGQQWMELQQWIVPQRFMRENLSSWVAVDRD